MSKAETEPKVYKSRGYIPHALWPEEKKAAYREKAKARRALNPEKSREYTAAWQERNPEKNKEKKDRWMKSKSGRLSILLSSARGRAKRLGREFSITADDLLPLPDFCPVLGIPINYMGAKRYGGFIEDSPSIDRVDSSKGYVPGNVRIISWRANSIKSDATIDELRRVLKYMEDNLGVPIEP